MPAGTLTAREDKAAPGFRASQQATLSRGANAAGDLEPKPVLRDPLRPRGAEEPGQVGSAWALEMPQQGNRRRPEAGAEPEEGTQLGQAQGQTGPHVGALPREEQSEGLPELPLGATTDGSEHHGAARMKQRQGSRGRTPALKAVLWVKRHWAAPPAAEQPFGTEEPSVRQTAGPCRPPAPSTPTGQQPAAPPRPATRRKSNPLRAQMVGHTF